MKLFKRLIVGSIILTLLLVFAIGAGLVFFKDGIIKTVLTTGMDRVIGIPLKIDRLNVGLLEGDVDVRGITIYNPDGFKGEILAVIPHLYINADVAALFEKKPHFELIEIDIAEIRVVRNKEGEINLNRIRSIASSYSKTDDADEPRVESTLEEEKKQSGLRIDKLVLSIDQLVYSDFKGRDKAKERRVSLGIKNEEFENLTDAGQIVSLIVLRVVTRGGLHGVGIAVEKLGNALKTAGVLPARILKESLGVLKKTGKVVTGGIKKLGKGIKKLGGGIKGIFKKKHDDE